MSESEGEFACKHREEHHSKRKHIDFFAFVGLATDDFRGNVDFRALQLSQVILREGSESEVSELHLVALVNQNVL